MKNSKIRQKIKDLSQRQTYLKNQRKTVNLVGEREIEPDVAQYKIWLNRIELRHLHMAYQFLKIGEYTPPKKTDWNQSKVDKLIKEYSEENVKIS